MPSVFVFFSASSNNRPLHQRLKVYARWQGGAQWAEIRNPAPKLVILKYQCKCLPHNKISSFVKHQLFCADICNGRH